MSFSRGQAALKGGAEHRYFPGSGPGKQFLISALCLRPLLGAPPPPRHSDRVWGGLSGYEVVEERETAGVGNWG